MSTKTLTTHDGAILRFSCDTPQARIDYLIKRLGINGSGQLNDCAKLLWQWIKQGKIDRKAFLQWCAFLDSE